VRSDCDNVLIDSTAVRAHERIHSDDRPYSCRRCHKAFKTSECLWHHENRSKSCGGLAKQQPLPPGDDLVRRRGRKRGRRDAQQLPVAPERTQQCVPASAGRQPSVSNSGGSVTAGVNISTAVFGGFRSVPAPALPFTVSAVSSTGNISSAGSISTPLTSNLSSSATLRRQLSSRFDVRSVGRLQTAGAEPILGRVVGGSSHREGLVLLANCAVSRPDDVTQVKVEPEVVLADYELTAMNSPEASFYERKRMAAAEITSATQAPPTSLSDLHVSPPETGSKSRSPGKDVGQLTSASGRVECRECGRQYASLVAYKKHALIHR